MVALLPIRRDLVRCGCNADALVLDMVYDLRMETSLALYARRIGRGCRDAVFLRSNGPQEYRTCPETTGKTLCLRLPILVELSPSGIYDGVGTDHEDLPLA